jgi:hypothetical protein
MHIKLFTMVKNEDDIVSDWIDYHGKIFGYNNLHIIDNYSVDETYNILLKYKSKGIHVYRECDYRIKGILLTRLINKERQNKKFCLAIPLDIDEFISYYDKDKNELIPSNTKSYIYSTIINESNHSMYKCNYINSLITTNDKKGYNNALRESEYGKYLDYGKMAKTFVNIHKWSGHLDHGNHCCTKNYFLTELVLVHYHCRNIEQIKKKVIANVTGLGYNQNVNELKKLLEKNPNIEGGHHVRNMIKILENKFTIETNPDLSEIKKVISLLPMKQFINN